MESSKKVLFKFDQKNVLKENEVVFNEPRLVAYKELDYNILKPAKKIYYFKKPEQRSYPIDLNRGFRTYTEKLASTKIGLGLKATLQYVMSSSGSEDANVVDKIKIFTRRGNLMDFMESMYPKRYPCYQVFHVTRYNGDLYMVAKGGEHSPGGRPYHSHDSQFLKNVFTESFNKAPNTSEPFDANKELLGVFQASFGEFELIYSSPIYGIKADRELEDFDDMDALNSCRFVMAKQMWWNRKDSHAKHLDYYLQARLANVKDLYFAYKDDDGIVKEPIVHKRASDLPNEYKSFWKPSTCFAFLYNFFKEVNKLMSKDEVNSLHTVYEFYVDQFNLTVTYKIFKDKPEMILVTPEYKKYCQEKFEN